MSRKPNLRCIVEGCDFRVGLNRPVFAFPRCPETSRLWRRANGIHPEASIRPNEGICSDHFEEAFLVRDECDARNVLLMPGAVPDLFPGGTIETLTAGPSHCRMCGSGRKTSLNNKVSVLRRDVEMLPVLDICLDLNGSANPLLPDGVCEACTSMVRFITRFAKTCWNAQDLLTEKYAPGKGYKFEPWKRLSECTEEVTEDYPLVEVIPEPEPEPETKPAPYEDHSENEMIELIPFEEVKQEELQLEISTPESPEKPPIEPEQTPPKPPKPSKPTPKRPTEPTRKRSRPLEASTPVGVRADSNELYKCDFCTLKFAIKKDLDHHIRTHIRSLHEAERKRLLQVEQFRCLRCRAQFQQAEQLKAHFAAQHQNKIQCRDCNLTFNYDSQLDKHNAQAHPERVTKKLPKPRNGSNAAGGGGT